MGILIKTLHLLGPPFLVAVSIPLTVCAFITTTLAVSLLAVRVSVVYFELGVALVHAYLFPEQAKPPPKRASPLSHSPPRARLRRSSSSSQETAVPAVRIRTKSGSSASLLGMGDATRDFEGVGGWRYYEGEEEEALWMGMNKRLELPIAMPRRHQRRHTGEDRRSWSPESLRMSPMQQSRSRTPTQQPAMNADADADADVDGYFPLQIGIRPLSTASEPLTRSALHSRRTSVVESSPTGGGETRRT